MARLVTDYDGAWKYAIEQMLSPLLELFLPKLWARVDWQVTPVFCDTELPRPSGFRQRRRHLVDKLVRLQLLDGSAFLVMLHLEVQDRPQPHFTKRMLAYYLELDHRLGEHHGICQLAILTDQSDWRPEPYRRSCFGTELAYDFNLVKLVDLERQLSRLAKGCNPFLLVVAAHLGSARTRRSPHQRSSWKRELFRAAFRYGRNREEISTLLNFVDVVMTLPPELDIPLAEVQNWEQQEANMRYAGGTFGPLRVQAWDEGMRAGEKLGEKRGENQGEKKGEKKIFRALLKARFGEVSADQLAKVESADSEMVMGWSLKLLTAQRVEEVFGK